MINKSTIRVSNRIKFEECLKLRKQGLSYSEIRKIVPIAKSTLQNWLAFAGLTLTKDHLEIQLHKRIEKRLAATEAARITRKVKRDLILKEFVQNYSKYYDDPLFIIGVMLYEAEGSKVDECRFSNSDHRLIKVFILFLTKFFSLNTKSQIRFSLFIHETRKNDLQRILDYWSSKLSVSVTSFKIFWKRNTVTKRRNNVDYAGQIQVRIVGVPYLTRKLLLLSDIIMGKYL